MNLQRCTCLANKFIYTLRISLYAFIYDFIEAYLRILIYQKHYYMLNLTGDSCELWCNMYHIIVRGKWGKHSYICNDLDKFIATNYCKPNCRPTFADANTEYQKEATLRNKLKQITDLAPINATPLIKGLCDAYVFCCSLKLNSMYSFWMEAFFLGKK